MKRVFPFFITITVIVLYKLIGYFTGMPLLGLLVLCVPISLLIVNMLLRKKLKYAFWFLSDYNIFLEKKKAAFESEISKELLFEKLLEVVNDSKFKLEDIDKENFQLLISTSPNALTWGENMYIKITTVKTVSVVTMTSVSVFGSYSWNRNDQHHKEFQVSFEESLTI